MDLEVLYKIIFGYLSNYIHSNTITANDYVLGISIKSGVVLEMGTSPDLIEEVLHSTSALFIGVLSIANEEYKMGLEAILKKYSIEIKK